MKIYLITALLALFTLGCQKKPNLDSWNLLVANESGHKESTLVFDITERENASNLLSECINSLLKSKGTYIQFVQSNSYESILLKPSLNKEDEFKFTFLTKNGKQSDFGKHKSVHSLAETIIDWCKSVSRANKET